MYDFELFVWIKGSRVSKMLFYNLFQHNMMLMLVIKPGFINVITYMYGSQHRTLFWGWILYDIWMGTKEKVIHLLMYTLR